MVLLGEHSHSLHSVVAGVGDGFLGADVDVVRAFVADDVEFVVAVQESVGEILVGEASLYEGFGGKHLWFKAEDYGLAELEADEGLVVASGQTTVLDSPRRLAEALGESLDFHGEALTVGGLHRVDALNLGCVGRLTALQGAAETKCHDFVDLGL